MHRLRSRHNPLAASIQPVCNAHLQIARSETRLCAPLSLCSSNPTTLSSCHVTYTHTHTHSLSLPGHAHAGLVAQVLAAANLTGARPANPLLIAVLLNDSTAAGGYGLRQGQAVVSFTNGRRVSVCDRGWTDDAATLFCRQYYRPSTDAQARVGQVYGQAVRGSYFGSDPTRPALVADLRCPAGDETNLVWCLGTLFASDAEAAAGGCGAADTAGVRCFNFDCECGHCGGL